MTGAVDGARPSVVGLVVVLVFWAYVVARLFALTTDPGSAALVRRSGLRPSSSSSSSCCCVRISRCGCCHLALALQAAIVLLLLALNPERDFVTTLFVAQCYQAAIVFAGRTRLVWVAVLVSLIGASLVVELGLLRGLSLALSPDGRRHRLGDVRRCEPRARGRAGDERAHGRATCGTAQRQLELYAGQVDELAAIEERSRVARELEESVSRTLSDVLAVARSARPVLDDPDRGRPQDRAPAVADPAGARADAPHHRRAATATRRGRRRGSVGAGGAP